MAATTTLPIQMTRFGIQSRSSRSRWATVRIETDVSVYVGRVFVPESKKRFSDVLGDDRPFINLTEVSIDGDESVPEPYIAINKRYIRTVRVLHDGEPETVPFRMQ